MTWLVGMTGWKRAGGGSAGLGWDNPKFCNEQLLQRVVKSWRLLQPTARSFVGKGFIFQSLSLQSPPMETVQGSK